LTHNHDWIFVREFDGSAMGMIFKKWKWFKTKYLLYKCKKCGGERCMYENECGLFSMAWTKIYL